MFLLPQPPAAGSSGGGYQQERDLGHGRITASASYLNRTGDLPAWFIDPTIEQAVETAVEHGEQNSHLALPPQVIRDILNRISARVASPETPVVAITSSNARYFLRQMVESTLPNIVFLAHNEVPPGLRVQSLGNIQ